MSPDPLGGSLSDPQTLNKYSYVRNNPLNMTDPTGMSSQQSDGWESCNGTGAGFEACIGAYTNCDPALACDQSNPDTWPWASNWNWEQFGILAALRDGSAVQCPDNECGTIELQNASGQVGIGVFTATQMAIGYDLVSPWLNAFPTPQELDAAFINQRDATVAALEKKGASVKDIQEFLGVNGARGKLAGGNFDFSNRYNNAPIFSFDCPHERCDMGGLGTLDFSHNDNTFHLDTADPWTFPKGTALHTGVDVFLGNYWYATIPRPWP